MLKSWKNCSPNPSSCQCPDRSQASQRCQQTQIWRRFQRCHQSQHCHQRPRSSATLQRRPQISFQPCKRAYLSASPSLRAESLLRTISLRHGCAANTQSETDDFTDFQTFLALPLAGELSAGCSSVSSPADFESPSIVSGRKFTRLSKSATQNEGDL